MLIEGNIVLLWELSNQIIYKALFIQKKTQHEVWCWKYKDIIRYVGEASCKGFLRDAEELGIQNIQLHLQFPSGISIKPSFYS